MAFLRLCIFCLQMMILQFGVLAYESPNVDYQIHSYNDLKELPQLLLKGARRFKFDPHYVSNHHNCLDATECFLLNHDQPASHITTYNTSMDLLSYLSSEEFLKLSKGERVTVALCFKSAPQKCQRTLYFRRWLGLVDAFHAKALETSPDNVEFILDGDGKPLDCLFDRWLPWKSVWINSDSPDSAFYSDEGDDAEERFQVLNNPESFSNWSWMASSDVNYGKFSESKYPYQLWEPDHQEDIQKYIEIYKSGSLHPPGFHFAINIDIAMFRIFSTEDENSQKQIVGKAINQPLQPITRQLSEGDEVTNPLLVKISNEKMISFTVLNNRIIQFSVLQFDPNNYKVSTVSTGELPLQISKWLLQVEGNFKETSLVQALVVYNTDTETDILLASNTGHLVKLTFEEGQLGLKLGDYQFCRIDLNELLEIQLVPSATCGDDKTCLFTISTEQTHSKIQLNIYEINNKSEIDEIIILESKWLGYILAPIQVVGFFKMITSAKMVSTETAVLNGISMLIFCAQDSAVYLRKVLISEGKIHEASTESWLPISVGTKLSLSSLETEKGNILMMVNDDGYCYNSHDHNTRPFPMVCSSQPISTLHILDYSIGLMKDWEKLLSVSAQAEKYLVNSCHERILHGSFDQGSRPSVVLFSPEHADNKQQAVYFLESHEAIRGENVGRTNLCGNAKPWEEIGADRSVILDSFPINEWVDNLVELM